MIDATLAHRIKLVAFDVDGVLTDGGLYIGRVGDHHAEFKRFDSQDGIAVWMLRRAGLVVALVTGRAAEATLLRAKELKIDEVVVDNHKLPAFEALLERRGLAIEECAFVGDDVPDLPVLRRVGLPIAVANAVAEVKQVAAYTTRAAGGHGAVREVAEVVLKARGEWDQLLEIYLSERGDVARAR
jgi:3-deoxy-D-manno-octulosonate 8-phosphate phosphatase (KDO 8-P phosphatase)